MSHGWIVAVLIASWSCLTLGAFMLCRSWAVVPLSLGLALGLVAWIYTRAALTAALHPPSQEPKK